jgi:hypothetical protein
MPIHKAAKITQKARRQFIKTPTDPPLRKDQVHHPLQTW